MPKKSNSSRRKKNDIFMNGDGDNLDAAEMVCIIIL